MARIRTIKPDFWTDETLGECSPTSRLLFVGTWNLADDHGNLERSAKQLRAQLFPYDAIDCEQYVAELLTAGVLIEYEVAGKKYLHIKGFDRHQKVEKKSSPRHPLYEDSLRTHRDLPDPSPSSSGSSLGREGKGREKEGNQEESARAARLPSDWALTSERKAIAESEHLDPDRTFSKFTDHWKAASGANARKRDWDAAWRNWCKNETDRRPNGSGKKPAAPVVYRTADEIEAEERARGEWDA